MIELSSKVKLYFYDEYDLELTNSYFLSFHNDINKNYKLLKKFQKVKDRYQNIIIKNYNDELIDILRGLYIKNDKKRIEFIYDNVCKRLDDKWNKINPCHFCNNKCYAAQKNYIKEENGCCYSFERKRFGKVEKKLCKYLGNDKKCKTSNISCKLFSCKYLKNNHIFNTSYEDFLILKFFFNKKQKLIIKYNFFRTRDEIINKLLEKNNKLYLVYLYSLDFVIKND